MPCFGAPEHSPAFQLFKLAFAILVLLHGIDAVKLDTKLNRHGCGESEPTGRIFQGKPIHRGQIPWIVHLVVKWRMAGGRQCGASIITSNVLLTAAHCVINPPDEVMTVEAYYNSTQFFGKPDKSDLLYIESMMPHQEYSMNKYGGWYDIALLQLPKRLKFDQFVKPVCLPSGAIKLAGKTLLVAGWGEKNKHIKYSFSLLFTQVVAMPDHECKRYINTVRTEHNIGLRGGPALCAKMRDGTTCNGDSGGPVTLHDSAGKSVQVGLVSLGPMCPEEGGTPTLEVHTPISFYLSWIRKVLRRPRMWQKLDGGRPVNIF